LNKKGKVFKKMNPEDIAYEASVAHYILFYDKDMDYVQKHNETQTAIETELAEIALKKLYMLEAAKATKSYVR